MGLLVNLWCINISKKVGNLYGGFVNVICSLQDMPRMIFLVKKEGRYMFQLRWIMRKWSIEFGLSMKFCPMKLKLDMEEFKVCGMREGGLRRD